MKLPSSFTTVTTFSKLLALSMFILFPIVGFKLGMTYQQQSQPPQVLRCPYSYPSPSTSSLPDVTDRNPSMQKSCEVYGGKWIAEYNECESMSGDIETFCKEVDGTYQYCQSPCRHDPNYPSVNCNQVCIQVCSVPDDTNN